APEFSHDRNGVAVEVTGEIAADHLPRVAAIVGAEEASAAEIKTRMRVRADDEWRIPVPAFRHFVFCFVRLDAKAFPGRAIEAHQAAVLRFGVNRVGIFGIDERAETVTALGDEPVLIVDAG